MVKVNNRNTTSRCEICSKLTIKIPERSWRRSGIFIVTYFTHCSSLSIVNFEQVNAGWVSEAGAGYKNLCKKKKRN